MKLCAIEPKELEEKILIRFAENQNDELLEDLSDYVINSQKEIERLNNIIKQIKKCIDYYAIENEDFSKLYNNEEIEILKIIGSDKE